VFIVLSISIGLATQVWAHGIGRPGLAGHLGAFHDGFGSHHPHPGFGPHFRGFGHPHYFPQHRFVPQGFVPQGFVPQGFGRPYSFPQHRFAPQGFGHYRHFRYPFGFRRGLFFGRSSVFYGPPAVIISSPFFCSPHRLGFTNQTLFFNHLHHAHRIPLTNALSFCTLVGSRFVFFGF
jgi:hypothetical protein